MDAIKRSVKNTGGGTPAGPSLIPSKKEDPGEVAGDKAYLGWCVRWHRE